LKGLAAYTDHALMNKKEAPEIYAFLHKAGAFLLSRDRHDLGKAVAMCVECGKVNITAMGLLYESHDSTLGAPSLAPAPLKPKPGKCILVSGHDMIILKKLLPLCDAAGINVYTHGEMLPAFGYEQLRKHKSLAGHYGGAWYRQALEFPHFPGPVLMTTNCLIENTEPVRARLFTAGAVGWPGCTHIGNNLDDIDFTPVIASAKSSPGFSESDKEFSYPDPIGAKRPKVLTVGAGHKQVLQLAPVVLEEIQKGNITRFFLIGGCDGFEGSRNYYADLVNQLPQSTIILTVGCGKFRINHLDLGTIPGSSGLPRLLDVGQCNDSFSAVQIALALAGALNCQVSDLPLSIVLSWFEQKAVAVLLSCVALGLKTIRVGPALPSFVTNDVLNVLVKDMGILPLGDPVVDAKAMLSAKGMDDRIIAAEGKGGKK
jgi:hydroxylamine reductase